MSRLVVFGDSFATGYWEVSKITEVSYASTEGWNTPFCEFLARDLGIDVLNLGIPGASNLSIMNDFLHYLKFLRKDGDRILFVWSHEERVTRMNHWQELPKSVTCEHINRFSGVYPSSKEPKTTSDKDCSSDYHFKIMASTCAYRTAKSFCEEFKLPYRMTNSLTNSVLWDTYYLSRLKTRQTSENEYEWQTTIDSLGIIPMMEKDNPNWIEGVHKYNTLVDICVGNWLSENKHKPLTDKYLTTIKKDWKKYPLLTHCAHPNQKGHKKISEILLPYIKELMDE